MVVCVESRRQDHSPTFAICVPQHNRTSFLIEAIDSIAKQRFQDVEICISDGCSTDGREQELVEALRAFGLPFVYQRSPTNLRYDQNTRTAISLARARYCILMGNDDALNGPDALSDLWKDMQQHESVGVVISDFCDYLTGQRAFRIRKTMLCGTGPNVAARHFRNFSFVSGIVLERATAQRLETDKWDGSEMYQTYIGCRMIASGMALLERAVPLVRKDIVIRGQSRVGSIQWRPKLWPCPIIQRVLPLNQLGRLVADAVAPHTPRYLQPRLNESVLLQLIGITYPYWLFEYRKIQSWRYATGVALGMRPARTANGVVLGLFRRLRVCLVYVAVTALGLSLPRSLFDAFKGWLYKLVKSS